jgi:beta-galactosidase
MPSSFVCPPVFRSALRLLCLVALSATAANAREESRLEEGWSFLRSDTPTVDASWQSVTLPHDWSISLPKEEKAPGLGEVGYFPTGIGWYQSTIAAPADWKDRRVELEFEGVAGVTEVWLNDVSLGRHNYAFTPFRVDLIPHWKPGADNLLRVKVDNSAQPAARWYTGSGLYRHVRLVVTDRIHLLADSLFVTTSELTAASARVRVEFAVRNDSAKPSPVSAAVALVDSSGKQIATVSLDNKLAAGAEWKASPELEVRDPQPWSPETPALYRAVIRVKAGDKPVDEKTVTFGIRTVKVSPEKGFELNGRTIKLFGGNLHSDHGPLGASVFPRAEECKVELMKAAGFNAVRTAHNPPSTAFLEACDRLGLLVVNEIFDGWEKAKAKKDFSVHFKADWAREVYAWVLRDRNHPSVVMWSAGNEMYERGAASGRRIAAEIVARIRALDPSRPVTAGVNGLGKTGDWKNLDPLFANFDVAGYNYEMGRAAADHARVPGRVIMASESYQSEAFANWATVQNHPFAIGDFVWSAMDYLGEAGLGRVFPPDKDAKKPWEAEMWPWHGADCGDIDFIGWRKPASHYRNIVWDRGEKLYAAVLVPPPGGGKWNLTPWSIPTALPIWTWPGEEGKPLAVDVYSRHDAVKLLLNGREIGTKPTTRAEEFKAVFTVPYEPGELKVVGLDGDREVETFILRTAGDATALRLVADRTTLKADGQDLAFVTVEAVDEKGNWQPVANAQVSFTVEGAGALAATGSADLTSTQSYAAPDVTLHNGRALAIVRTTRAPGAITLKAAAPGLAPATIDLKSTNP